jgi:Tol biopolymer transport system component
MHLSLITFLGFAATAVHASARYMGYDRDLTSSFNVHSARGLPAANGKKGVFLMNRIGPSSSEIYLANADGTNPRKLLGKDSQFEYHASFSSDGKWILFTSERNGDGNSDIYRVRLDGSGLEKLRSTPSVEDVVSLSPDGSKIAYVSSEGGSKANIWVEDLKTRIRKSLTNTAAVAGDASLPNGYFRPQWSPDGKWLVFSSDRNTGWTGHSNGTGWEHTQSLSIYAIRPDGSGFRQVATKPGYCLGSPKFSPDGKHVIYYEMTLEDTWNARRPDGNAKVVSQIVSVDFETGGNRTELTSGPGCKVFGQYVTANNIGYYVKGGPSEGIYYTQGNQFVNITLRSPSWSPDGKMMVYEVPNWAQRPLEKPLYSWDSAWEYRFTDVFPQLSQQNKLALTDKQLGTSSIVTYNPDGSNRDVVFDAVNSGALDPTQVAHGQAGAFQPAWSPNGQWIAFGLGQWFQGRAHGTAKLYRTTANGSHYEALTDGTVNSGFPSYSADGRYIVFREWGARNGLRSKYHLFPVYYYQMLNPLFYRSH